VAAKNEINPADLLEINDINSISLMPGTTLSVPILGDEKGGIIL
jgi:LysM repeat protein